SQQHGNIVHAADFSQPTVGKASFVELVAARLLERLLTIHRRPVAGNRRRTKTSQYECRPQAMTEPFTLHLPYPRIIFFPDAPTLSAWPRRARSADWKDRVPPCFHARRLPDGRCQRLPRTNRYRAMPHRNRLAKNK